MSPKIIPYARHYVDLSDVSSVVDSLKSDFITQGPNIPMFESAFSAYVGSNYGVAFNNATSALIAACFALGIKPGDEVITTPYTFCASTNCFVWLGAKPKFCDIDEETLNIDPRRIEKLITKKTKAILTVDFAGLACDYKRILRIAEAHGLVVIDDASHALGSEFEGKKLGTIADATCFSFHPAKTITTGEGGMVTTQNKKVYENLRVFRHHGITKRDNYASSDKGPWFYEMRELGLNLRLTDFQAALGISQLKKLGAFIKRRQEIVNFYNDNFSELPIILPFAKSGAKTVRHLYPVRLELDRLKVGRKKIFSELHKEGIFVQVHYIPVHLMPYYSKRFGFTRGNYPVAEKVYDSEISLPLFPAMKKEDVARVVKVFKNVIQRYQR